MSYSPIKLPISYIEEFRRCVNNNDHLILNNKPYRQTWNILCACMDRIEDTAKYLNSKVLGEKHDYGCAFDLMEFLSHSASMLDCIDTIIETLKAEDKIELRVWERGCGITQACGTGACATTVAAILNGLVEHSVDVKLLGGTVHIDWPGNKYDSNHDVYMTGPAEYVFTAELSN